MEILSLNSLSSHFPNELESIHSHFSGRTVNEHLHYYRDRMDHHKRGVAISALLDGQEKIGPSGAASRNAVPRSSQALQSPSAATSRVADRSPVTNTSSVSAMSPSYHLDHQKRLPSFSALDHEHSTGSKLHEEILARHGRGGISQPSRSFDSSPRAADLWDSPSTHGHHGTPGYRQHQSLPPMRQPERRIDYFARQTSPSELVSHRRSPFDSRGERLPRPHTVTNSPNAGPRNDHETAFAVSGHSRQSYSDRFPLAESATPLSDILDKTRAQIASQHQRNDSAFDRNSSYTTDADRTLSRPAPGPTQFTLPTDQFSPTYSNHHQPIDHAGIPHSIPHTPSVGFRSASASYHQYELPRHGQQAQSNLPSSASGIHVSNVAARKRRGNLPREAVRLFKKWVEENKRYPYPNEAQKQDFERMTGLSMQQINNWFINARRRNLSERERAEMKREKEQQSQSGSPVSTRPDSSHGLPEPDAFSLGSSSRRASYSREHSRADSGQRMGGFH